MTMGTRTRFVERYLEADISDAGLEGLARLPLPVLLLGLFGVRVDAAID
jgi:hypothetical protein